MDYNLIGFFALAVAAVLIVPLAIKRPVPLPAKLLLAAVLLRVVGSTARYEVNIRFYGGSGDAFSYFQHAMYFARSVWEFDLSVLTLGRWFGFAHWWGTVFMENLTGLVVTVIGPSVRGAFLVFSILSLIGLYLMVVAAFRSLSLEATVRYAAWIFLWPSLWFWPSSIGKESVTILAIGIATLGFVGRAERVRWTLFALGLGLAFAIRPHVAAVLAFAAVAAHWLGTWDRFNKRRFAETVLLLIILGLSLQGITNTFGEDIRFPLERITQIDEFLQFWRFQTSAGGSYITAAPAGILGIPLAFVNVWMRPFPWEPHNLTSLMSAAEILLLWWLVWRNRTGLGLALRHWRKNRLLRFGLPLLLAYTLMVGFTFGNLGIIARQRTPVFPFFLVLLTCVPVRSRVPAPAAPAPPAAEPARAG